MALVLKSSMNIYLGERFLLYTDHKPLLGLLDEDKSIPVQASARIQRWALTLEMYQYQLKFKTSNQNANADALCRLPLTTMQSPTPQPTELVLMMEALDGEMPVSSHQIKTWTRRDPTLSRVLQFVQKGWPATVKDEQLKIYEKKVGVVVSRSLPVMGQSCGCSSSRAAGYPSSIAFVSSWCGSHEAAGSCLCLVAGYGQRYRETCPSYCSACQVNQSSPPVAPVIPIRW